MNAFEKAEQKNGTVIVDDVEYALLCEPHPSDIINLHGVYVAKGISNEMNGKEVTIAWDILEGMESCDDASAACDWEHGAYLI